MVFPILGSGDSSSGYDIDNSLRFNRGDAPALSYSFSSTAASWTVSCWIKLGEISLNTRYPFGFGTAGTDAAGVSFASGDSMAYYDEDGGTLIRDTTKLVRDVSAWYHMVAKNSSGTVTIYLNNIQQATGSGGEALDGSTFYVGRFAGNTAYHWDGYISEFYFIDGTAYSPNTFAETDSDSGIWKPKKASVTFGSDGFFMEFKQTGTDADSSGIGADTSGNDNHMTVTNLAAADQATDTPTNNFATLNPLYPATEANFSQGNCRYVGGTTAGNGVNQMAAGTFAVANGKWYFECKLINVASNGMIHTAIGIMSANHPSLIGTGGAYPWTSGWVNYNHYLYTPDGNSKTGNTSSSYGSAISEDDIVGVALDLDNDAIYYSVNGTFINSGDPTSGASKTNAAPNFPTDSGPWILGFNGDASSGDAAGLEYNFGGCSAFTVSSGNADANGYGNFEYAVPSGYYAPCTKNLAEYG